MNLIETKYYNSSYTLITKYDLIQNMPSNEVIDINIESKSLFQ
ncbi:MAG: hypothetical protein AAGK97_16675 [Bacteroidota bacterium]